MRPAHLSGALEQAMNLSIEQRETLERWLPTLLVVTAAWLATCTMRQPAAATFGIGPVMFRGGGGTLF
jgi:hypothetical protein